MRHAVAVPTKEKRTRTYRLVMAFATPIVRWWGRLEVIGLDLLPTSGPVLLMANHDSMWDPLVLGVAARTRQVCALAKASLWRIPGLSWVLDRMGQIPIERGRGDLEAMSAAVAKLESGGCIGVFPEGTVSDGAPVRVHSGAGRLALARPGVTVCCAAAVGVVDIVRFPRRPRIRVEFFLPSASEKDAESAIKLTRRVMADIRSRAPYASRRRTQRIRQQA